MKIGYLENDGSSMYKVRYLEEYENHEIWHSDDFRDVMSWLEFDPGADAFGALMFDLVLPSDSLRLIERNAPKYEEKIHYSPSLYFIKEYLLKKFPQMKDRIILCSAHFKVVEQKGCNLDDYLKMDKNSPHMADELVSMLRELEERHNGR
ncbi:hypothetical protein AGMMS49975_25000 [Clostridia bacterium]|nr:hypothetical protein AGMMS49975_25000 [Clostridia bacterium]